MAIPSWLCHIRVQSLSGLFCLVLGSLVSCQSAPTANNSPLSRNTNQSIPPTPPSAITAKPQSKTFSLTVDNPNEDLKIQQGTFVQKGQIIATLVQKRLTLENQKRVLESDLKALESSGAISFSTQLEEERVALATQQVNEAQAVLQQYKVNSPWTDFARNNLPLAKEEGELTLRQENVQQAQKNLDDAKATLAQKQAAIGTFQNEQVTKKTGIQQMLLNVEQKLAALKPIKASYTGTIAKIDVPKTTSPGTPVKVTVTLILGDSPQTFPSSNAPLSNGISPKNNNSSSTGSTIDLPPSQINRPNQDPSSANPLLNPTGE